MRKVLLFLALFGIGLAVLLLLQRRAPRPDSSAPERGAPTAAEQFTEVPLEAEEPGQDGGSVRILLQGQVDVTQFQSEGAERKPLRKLHADDSQALGGNVYVLRGMKLSLFDPETGKTTAELVSPRTRLKFDVVDGKPTIGEGDKALLSDVQATLFEKAPVVPLVFEIPMLEWQVGGNRLLSEKPVKISGPGLRASGDALDADIATGRILLPTSGSIELELPREVRAILAATGSGPIEVRKTVVEGVEHVELVASQGARLSASGEEPFQLDATEIRMIARKANAGTKRFDLVQIAAKGNAVARSRGDTFRADEADFHVGPEGRFQRAELHGAVSLESPEGSVRGDRASFDFGDEGRRSRAHVEGSTVLQHGEDSFRSQAADFEFGPDGKLSKATLVGDPVGTVEIGRFLPPGQPELRAAHAELEGPGPLVLEFAGRTKVELSGPSVLRIPEANLVLSAERSLVGEAEADHKSGKVTADGAVKVTWGSDDLQSDRVTLSTSIAVSGDTVVDAETVGSTTIHRTLADGAKVTLVATDGLQARSVGKVFVVPLARGVDLSAEGPNPFRAHAATVRDFDWESRAFVAEGDVSFESERGKGTADRVVARGTEDVELTGSTGKPARFSRVAGAGEELFEEAKIEGISIHAREDSLDAAGEVSTDFTASDASYHLEGGEVHVEFDAPEAGQEGAPRPFRATASSSVKAWVQTLRGESTLFCRDLRISGTTRGAARAGAAPDVVASDVRAEGAVVVDWSAQGGIVGEGELFVIDAQNRGRLSAAPGERVRASGRLSPEAPPYDLDADWIEFDKERLEAQHVNLRLRPAVQAPPIAPVPGSAKPVLGRLSADRFLARPEETLLEGNAHADGRTAKDEAWSIDAGSIRIGGEFKEKGGFSPADFEIVQAWDGFDARLGDRGSAKGTRLEGKRLEGEAGEIRLDGEPAELSLGPIVMRSAWFKYETESMLLATDKGEIGPVEGGSTPWSLTYESLQPFDKEDKTILALRNPIFRDGDVEMRALWMLFWIDREEWRRSGRKAMSESTSGTDLRVKDSEADPQAPPPEAQSVKKPQPKGDVARLGAAIAKLRADPISKVLSEAYIEGNIELTQAGARRARASTVYLDLVEGHGWVRDADFLEEVDIRSREQQMRIRAEWLRVSSDLSLRADKATLTFCGYDEPHFVVETGDLRLKPNPGGKVPYDVSATKNALRFANGWAIPLPPLVYSEDEEGNPIVENLNLGQSAKFGASIGATFNVGLGKVGKGVGKFFGNVLSLPKDSVKGHWSFHADYLGSRGLLLGTGLELRSGETFKLDAEFSAIPDGNEDKGLIQVDEDERSTLRDWFRSRGRYTVSRQEWFDLALSIQSDPGVQSEFFERDYFRYEQKDNYLHWRKARESWLVSSSVKVLLEDRTDVEELPKAGLFRGRAPIGSLGDLEVLYTGTLDVGYFRRKEGSTSFLEPGEPIPPGYGPYEDFEDPLGNPGSYGERDVARVDTRHRFETPFALDFSGLRATPWVEGRATFWDRGIDPEDSPQRGSVVVGFDLSTSFWRPYGREVMHALTPFVSVHGDVVTNESDGQPVRFDQTEDSIAGRFVDVGLRSRVWNSVNKERFDVEVRATHAADLPDGQPDGIQPVGVLAELLTWMGSVPFGVSHDGRYDVEEGDTVYSRSYLGLRPHPKWDVELGYHRGVDGEGLLLYEAASAGTRYRATSKWELELGETISLSDDADLASQFTLRRIGHDFVTELELGYVAGEGSRFSISLSPILTWRPGGLGLLDRWLGR